jgi:TolB-like protein/Flp pilus assembly protein TadD
MEKAKEKRYQSAGELSSELTRIEKGIPTTERIVPKRKPLTSREITVQFSLKKLFVPALIFIALIVFGVILWRVLPKKPVSELKGKPSIAVLPFEDLSPEKDQGYLCDGMAVSIISALTNINNLYVPASTSSFSIKDKGLSIHEIGEKLKVKTVLKGTLQKVGKRVRIIVQLINTADDSVLWSAPYNKDMGDVLDLQDEISLEIVDKLRVKLLGEEKVKLLKRYTHNIEAYNLYLKGLYFWNLRTEESLNKAIQHFEEAIQKDPNYALAYTGLADCYNLLPWYGGWLPKEAYPKAKAAALKALEIDDMLAEAHTSLAAAYEWFDRNWTAAEREYRLAIELNPSYATGHHWYGCFLGYMQRLDESITELKRALELDPLSAIINTNLGDYLYYARRYEEAIEQYKKTLEIFPNWRQVPPMLGSAYLKKGMIEEALITLEENGSFRLIFAYMASRRRNEALREAHKHLENWKNQSLQKHIRPDYLAYVYLSIGEIDKAFESLEKGYQERYPSLLDFISDPLIDSIRKDVRFKELMKKMKLEQWAE